MAFATYLSAAVGLAGLGVAGAALGPFLLMTGPLMLAVALFEDLADWLPDTMR